MEQESVVYGFIKTISCFDRLGVRKQADTNWTALQQLPRSDEGSFLTRDMFSMPRLALGEQSGIPGIIHFGMGYDGVEYEWNLWMKEFEALLQTMVWQSATVHLQTELSGSHSFVWEAVGEGHRPNATSLDVRCEWNHELGIFDKA